MNRPALLVCRFSTASWDPVAAAKMRLESARVPLANAKTEQSVKSSAGSRGEDKMFTAAIEAAREFDSLPRDACKATVRGSAVSRMLLTAARQHI